MRPILRLCIVVLVASAFSPAEAQTEYFTNGERLISGSTFVQRGEDLNGLGFEVEVAPSSRVALSLGYGNAEIRDQPIDIGQSVEISTWSGAIMAYPVRQGENGGFTFGIGFSGGYAGNVIINVPIQGVEERYEESVITLGPNVLAASVLTPTGSPVRAALQAQVGAAMLLGTADIAYAQTLGLGLGVGLAISSRALVTMEPSALFTRSGDESATTIVGALGLAYSF